MSSIDSTDDLELKIQDAFDELDEEGVTPLFQDVDSSAAAEVPSSTENTTEPERPSSPQVYLGDLHIPRLRSGAAHDAQSRCVSFESDISWDTDSEDEFVMENHTQVEVVPSHPQGDLVGLASSCAAGAKSGGVDPESESESESEDEEEKPPVYGPEDVLSAEDREMLVDAFEVLQRALHMVTVQRNALLIERWKGKLAEATAAMKAVRERLGLEMRGCEKRKRFEAEEEQYEGVAKMRKVWAH